MRSVVVEEFGGSDQLQLVETPDPEPGPEDVRVRVAGAAVNWIDLSVRAGRLAGSGLLVPAERYSLGWDVSGVVEAVGTRVNQFWIGKEVVGLRDVLGLPGTHADHVVLHKDAIARAPARVDLADAAALPLAGVTALGALAASGVREGQRLLVTGAAGVIGRMVVAVAVSRGVEVVAVARGGDASDLERAGAAHVDVDGPGPLAARARRLAPAGVDAVIDTANLGAAAHETLRGAGTFVALVRPFAPLPLRGTLVVVHEAWADPELLAEVVFLVEAGVIEVPATHRIPLEDAARAHELMEDGVRGRVVLVPWTGDRLRPTGPASRRTPHGSRAPRRCAPRPRP